ncbi:universal stress protein [Noviherbaspirillum sedimenti]|uniref:Universal stress protein UspA n=1 Tax=Noviherbaspirillum sedimenti TaxID=2320865 RepID=A0A3A3GL52_9BURK|nr:universal stress protein [Noviherbaspirillum sedimenti]RJG02996.1 universal stress protein UspA [Noviherbaspirillum sedimenti]
MYRHLLVPVDNTDLSTVTTGQAVEFARAIGARITFLHAQASHASSPQGKSELSAPISSKDSAYKAEGWAKELLAKAESAARAQGIPCSSVTAIGDTPFSAILATAREKACDLIFMASHGRRSAIGEMPGSQTLQVLAGTKIPVLVTATAGSAAATQAIGILQDEHRSLAAVLHAWLFMLASPQTSGMTPDAAQMQAMLHYIRTFPLTLHHPKEQQYLFGKLRERTSALNAELDELERQHERDGRLVAELSSLVDRYAAGSATAGEVEAAVAAYAKLTWEHLGREEGVILPAALRYLTDEDWAVIHSAFAENKGPHFGNDMDAEFQRLYARIADLAA